MSKYTSLATLTLGLLAAMPAMARVAYQPAKAPSEARAIISHMAAPAPERNGALSADFSIAGGSALTPVLTINFDDPASHGWTLQNDNAVAWSVKQTTGNKAFSAIDPADAASLHVEGPYQVFKRAISSATSPEIAVAAKSTLTFYVGFSLNYEDNSSLTLYAVDDEEETALWTSADQKGEKPWAWRQISVDLDAFGGKTIRLRFTYGPGSADTFGTGGYSGDYIIDGLTISEPKTVESVSVMTGEDIALVDLSEGATSWMWEMPGATPSTSTDRNPTIFYTADGTYDITLTVSDAEGNKASKTRTGFATVTGTAPQARIIPPATFRNSANRLPLVAPQVPVTFLDGSTGFPTKHTWTFTGVEADPGAVYISEDENPSVGYSYLHTQAVGLEVENAHGKSADLCEVSVEYSAVATNMRPDDRATVKDMEDWGVFPGSNTQKITAYAERFSKPSRPLMIDGAYVYFDRAEATEVIDQIASVSVRLCKSENGQPGEELDFMCWSVFELDLPANGQMVGTAFPFTTAPIVDDEFFIVVDGLPEFSDGCCVSFSMAGFRSEGNTAMMKKDGKWMEVPEYFGANGHTSFMIYPSVNHSVMNFLSGVTDGKVEVGADPAEFEVELFSYMGYKDPQIDADWLKMTSTPNGMTVDQLKFACEAMPAGTTEREATVTLTDGASQLSFIVRQSGTSAIDRLPSANSAGTPEVYDLLGRRLLRPARGLNLINGHKTLVK